MRCFSVKKVLEVVWQFCGYVGVGSGDGVAEWILQTHEFKEYQE
jgi:hypothetical protein